MPESCAAGPDSPANGSNMGTKIVARPTGVEPVTFGFGNQHSIQLSYGRTQPRFYPQRIGASIAHAGAARHRGADLAWRARAL